MWCLQGWLIVDKNFAKKVADSQYFSLVGKQAPWARGGLDGLVGKMGKWGWNKAIKEKLDKGM